MEGNKGIKERVIQILCIPIGVLMFLFFIQNIIPDKPRVSMVLVEEKIEIQGKINLNTATIEELDTLEGVGVALAERIVEYRKHTPFNSVEEIKHVKGISDKILEKNQDKMTVK